MVKKQLVFIKVIVKNQTWAEGFGAHFIRACFLTENVKRTKHHSKIGATFGSCMGIRLRHPSVLWQKVPEQHTSEQVFLCENSKTILIPLVLQLTVPENQTSDHVFGAYSVSVRSSTERSQDSPYGATTKLKTSKHACARWTRSKGTCTGGCASSMKTHCPSLSCTYVT